MREGRASARQGEVSELADEHDLGSCAERRRSSSLLFPTVVAGATSAARKGCTRDRDRLAAGGGRGGGAEGGRSGREHRRVS